MHARPPLAPQTRALRYPNRRSRTEVRRKGLTSTFSPSSSSHLIIIIPPAFSSAGGSYLPGSSLFSCQASPPPSPALRTHATYPIVYNHTSISRRPLSRARRKREAGWEGGACVCVCAERERGERERECVREREKETERGRERG